MEAMAVSEARANLAQVVERVRYSGYPIYLTRRDNPVAALVDIKFFEGVVASGQLAPPQQPQDMSLTERINAAIESDPQSGEPSFSQLALRQFANRQGDEEW